MSTNCHYSISRLSAIYMLTVYFVGPSTDIQLTTSNLVTNSPNPKPNT